MHIKQKNAFNRSRSNQIFLFKAYERALKGLKKKIDYCPADNITTVLLVPKGRKDGRSRVRNKRNEARLSPGPAFFRHTGRCIDVDKTRLAINHRVVREKKESFSPVYSSHGGSRQFAAVSLSPTDNGSLSSSLCSAG